MPVKLIRTLPAEGLVIVMSVPSSKLMIASEDTATPLTETVELPPVISEVRTSVCWRPARCGGWIDCD